MLVPCCDACSLQPHYSSLQCITSRFYRTPLRALHGKEKCCLDMFASV